MRVFLTDRKELNQCQIEMDVGGSYFEVKLAKKQLKRVILEVLIKERMCFDKEGKMLDKEFDVMELDFEGDLDNEDGSGNALE